MKLLACTVLALCLLAPAAFANDKFEGEWVLDLEATQGLRVLPKSMKQTVSIEDGNVVIHRDIVPAEADPRIEEFTYLTSGETHTVPAGPTRTRDVVAGWKGKKLVVTYEFEPREGLLVKAKETWRIKKGQLLVKTNATTPMGGRTIKMFFNRP